MNTSQAVAQAMGLAYIAGLNLYATVAIIGLAARLDWIGPLPAALGALSSPWVIVLATALMTLELLASCIPVLASIWDTLHSLIRPPAAAVLAAAALWHSDPVLVLLTSIAGGGLALTTHTTKLGLRYAIDTSPEPLSNGVVSIGELGIIATIAISMWHHPYLTLTAALLLLVLLILTVRLIWRTLRQVLAGRWVPLRGFLQEPRTSDRMERRDDE